MGLGDLPDMHSMDNPDGTLTTAGANKSSPAFGPGIAAAPPFPVDSNIREGTLQERKI
jgi:hypothetical protein